MGKKNPHLAFSGEKSGLFLVACCTLYYHFPNFLDIKFIHRAGAKLENGLLFSPILPKTISRCQFLIDFDFSKWLEMPGALILLIVVAPSFFASTLRGSWIGVVICFVIACYLLQEHIRASGGLQKLTVYRTPFLLFVYPAWA